MDYFAQLGPDGMVQSFADLPKRSPMHVIALTRRTPYLRVPDLLKVNGGAALEAKFPAGVAVRIRVVNPDGGLAFGSLVRQ